ncbi:MAG: hypothetical protein L0G99_09870 [Propionibacteriales bacterium]|nr:hypothetical protein [Propionibacteriales bacterium]
MTEPAAFTVFPIRFSDDPGSMITFLRTLGMAALVTTESDGYAELRAGAGRVMVHRAEGSDSHATSGTTDLSFAVDSIDAVAPELDGLNLRVWDESYGRQGLITGPAGEDVSLNEAQTDLYGYRGPDGTEADPRLVVTAVRPSADFAADTTFFGRLGFTPETTGNKEWQALRGLGTAGVLGLHRPADGERSSRKTDSAFGTSATVRLGFETSEDLDELAARFTGAGYAARVVDQQGLRAVHLTAPAGQPMEVHQTPGR